MELDEYQREQQRTANTTMTRALRREIAGLGMIGEAGEYADIVKKHLGQGHPLDAEKMANEGFDCVWYAVEALTTFGVSLDGRALREISDKALAVGCCPADAARVMADFAADYNNALMAGSLWEAAKHASGFLAAAFSAVHASGTDFGEALAAHVAKLRARYPSGFDAARSINRPAGNGG